jgi:hypothetical protein
MDIFYLSTIKNKKNETVYDDCEINGNVDEDTAYIFFSKPTMMSSRESRKEKKRINVGEKRKEKDV